MIANRNFGQSEPLTWIGQMPVYLSTALAIVHAVCLVLSALALAMGFGGFVSHLPFSVLGAVVGHQVWQFITYAFTYNDSGAYLLVAIQIYMLAVFGGEVERFIGRRQFAFLYVALILAVPLFLTVVSFFFTTPSYVVSGAGSGASFAVFIAFALIYPRAQVFFGIEARWIALGLVVIYSLMFLASQSWIGVGMFWVECGVALFWMAKEGVQGMSLPSFSSFKSFAATRHSKRHLNVVRREIEPEKEDPDLHESIDPILDKIAKSGIGSLTRSEREKLERARVALLEKEARR